MRRDRRTENQWIFFNDPPAGSTLEVGVAADDTPLVNGSPAD